MKSYTKWTSFANLEWSRQINMRNLHVICIEFTVSVLNRLMPWSILFENCIALSILYHREIHTKTGHSNFLGKFLCKSTSEQDKNPSWLQNEIPSVWPVSILHLLKSCQNLRSFRKQRTMRSPTICDAMFWSSKQPCFFPHFTFGSKLFAPINSASCFPTSKLTQAT